MIAQAHMIAIKLTIICIKNLHLELIHFISSIIAMIAKNPHHINKAHIWSKFQYQGKNIIIENIVASIRKIHISFGTGVALFKSLYFQGASSIQNFLNKNNHKIPIIVETNIVHKSINIIKNEILK